MRPDPSQKALRRLVAGLAKAGSADIEAVLSQLGPRERSRVEELLDAYRQGRRPAAKVTPIAPGMSQIEHLSPWLADRIDGGPQIGRMTETAAAALQAAATALRREGGIARPRIEAPERQRISLVGRIRRAATKREPR